MFQCAPCCCVLPLLPTLLSIRGPELDSTLPHQFPLVARGTARTHRCGQKRSVTVMVTYGRARGFGSAPLNMLRNSQTSNVHVKMTNETSMWQVAGHHKSKKEVYGVQSSTSLHGCGRAVGARSQPPHLTRMLRRAHGRFTTREIPNIVVLHKKTKNKQDGPKEGF